MAGICMGFHHVPQCCIEQGTAWGGGSQSCPHCSQGSGCTAGNSLWSPKADIRDVGRGELRTGDLDKDSFGV